MTLREPCQNVPRWFTVSWSIDNNNTQLHYTSENKYVLAKSTKNTFFFLSFYSGLINADPPAHSIVTTI